MTADKGNPETANNTFSSSLSEVTSIGGGWYYSRYTFTFATNPTGGSYVTFGIQTLANTSFIGETFDVYQAQFEVKPYPTPFVLGTRGTTVATGGGWADLSGNNNHGTLINGPTFSSLNNSMTFNGVDNSVNTSFDLTWNHLNSVNISVWLKSNLLTQNKPIIGSGNFKWQIRQGLGAARNSLGFMYWDSGGGHSNGPTFEVLNFFDSTSTWVHTTIAWNHLTSILSIYKNGGLVASGVYSNPSVNRTSIETINIGGNVYNWGSTGRFWNGNISAVTIHTRVLTPQEILQNYNATKSRYGL